MPVLTQEAVRERVASGAFLAGVPQGGREQAAPEGCLLIRAAGVSPAPRARAERLVGVLEELLRSLRRVVGWSGNVRGVLGPDERFPSSARQCLLAFARLTMTETMSDIRDAVGPDRFDRLEGTCGMGAGLPAGHRTRNL